MSPAARYEATAMAALLARHKLEVIGGVQSSADAMGAFLGGVADYKRERADLESTRSLQQAMHEAFKAHLSTDTGQRTWHKRTGR
jgi:hypothetical protein